MNKFRRVKALAGFWLVGICFGLVFEFSYKNVGVLLTISKARQHAAEMLAAVERLSSSLEILDAERTAYVASRRDNNFKLFYADSKKVGHIIGTLKRLTRDNPDQQRQLVLLLPLLAQQQRFDQSIIDSYKPPAKTGAGNTVPIPVDEPPTAAIARLVSEMSDGQREIVRQLDTTVGTTVGHIRDNVVSGSLIGMFVVVLSLVSSRREIAQRKKAEEKVKLLSVSLEQTTELVLVAKAEGEIEYINKATEKATGHSAAKLIGKNWKMLNGINGDEAFFQELHDTLAKGSTFHAVVDKKRKNGEIVSLEETVTPIVDKDGTITHLISTGKDITRLKSLEIEVDLLANYDALTGLPRRHLLIQRLGQEILEWNKNSGIIAVMILDIDRFKLINNVLGFDAGDRILKTLAARLRDALSEGAFVARHGSDEFSVVATHFANTAEVIPTADRLLKRMARPITIQTKEYFVTAGVGVALYPENGEDAAILVRNAEAALAEAKYRGRSNCQFYSEDLSAKASTRLVAENSLFAALSNQEYLLSYQPYFELTTVNIAGAEALIKWKNDSLGLMSPVDFIPTLEDTGLILDVGEWVLRTACRQLKEWDARRSFLPISVNLSGAQFRHKDIVHMVDNTVRDFQLDPSLLTLEVTESTFIHDLDFAYRVLTKLKDIGISISVDDFGTGYSSLSYLKKLPVDNIKIDKSFIKDVATDPDSVSIVTTIVSMARSLNLKTIAEGVETEEQWKVLRLLRCDMGQGFYFSPALSPEEMERYS